MSPSVSLASSRPNLSRLSVSPARRDRAQRIWNVGIVLIHVSILLAQRYPCSVHQSRVHSLPLSSPAGPNRLDQVSVRFRIRVLIQRLRRCSFTGSRSSTSGEHSLFCGKDWYLGYVPHSPLNRDISSFPFLSTRSICDIYCRCHKAPEPRRCPSTPCSSGLSHSPT